MNRQQYAITLTGIGGILLLTIFLMGGPEFSWECSSSDSAADCEESFSAFIFSIVWTFFAFGLGGVLFLVGIILFIVDASQRNAVDGDE